MAEPRDERSEFYGVCPVIPSFARDFTGHPKFNYYMYYVYILQSEKDGLLYTGYTEHLAQRIKQHNEGSTRSTQNRRPLKLIYYEAYPDKDDALGREKFLKSGSGKRFVKKQLRHYFSNSG